MSNLPWSFEGKNLIENSLNDKLDKRARVKKNLLALFGSDDEDVLDIAPVISLDVLSSQTYKAKPSSTIASTAITSSSSQCKSSSSKQKSLLISTTIASSEEQTSSIVKLNETAPKQKKSLSLKNPDLKTSTNQLKPAETTPKKLTVLDLPDIFNPKELTKPPRLTNGIWNRLGPAKPATLSPPKLSPTFHKWNPVYTIKSPIRKPLQLPKLVTKLVNDISATAAAFPAIVHHFHHHGQGKSRCARKRLRHKIEKQERLVGEIRKKLSLENNC